jgi:hypothetical protein
VDKIRDAIRDVVHDDGSGIQELRRPFYPLLKPFDWADRAREAGVLVRPLSLHVALPAHTPVVGLAVDAGEAVAFLKRTDLPELLDDEELAAIACQNLRELLGREGSFEAFEIPGPEGAVRLLSLQGSYYASEALLVPETLAFAHDELGAETLAAAAPIRGQLLLTDADGGVAALHAFATVVARAFSMAEVAPISPHVFGVREGRLVGYLDGLERIQLDAATEVRAEREAESGAIAVRGARWASADGDTLVYVFTTEDAELLLSTMEEVLRGEAQDRDRSPELSGQLHVEIALTPLLAEAREALEPRLLTLVEFLDKQFETLGLGPREGCPFRVSYDFDLPEAE